MANAKEIKRKISSITNTTKITKAMEMISTVKMKKAQSLAMSKKAFTFEMLKIFLKIESHLSDFPLFSYGTGKKTLAVVITSNRGLCGGYNINVMKKIHAYMQETNEQLDFITIGKKGSLFVAKTGNQLVADFSSDFSDNLEQVFTREISRFFRDEFLRGQYKKVVIFYNHYVNTIKQIAVCKTAIPLDASLIKEYLLAVLGEEFQLADNPIIPIDSYTMEPSHEILAQEVIPIILDMIFHDVLLEAKASEHSSRMVAMKNAKENSATIASQLNLKYNKARQMMITREVSEIVAGVESMRG